MTDDSKKTPPPTPELPTPEPPSTTAHEQEGPRLTRAGALWAAVVGALVVLVLLIIFFLQNQDTVRVRFLGLDGLVPLGLALFIAAVAGGILVAIAGMVRIVQLRVAARRRRPRPQPRA